MIQWEHFPHDADIGVRGWGDTLESAFAQTALALTAVVTDPSAVRELAVVDLACEAPDAEQLLFDWLNAVVYEMATRHMLFSRYQVSFPRPGWLEAKAWGEPVDPARHAPAVEVKGATYTMLRVGQRPQGGWFAQCVVDV